MPALIGVTLGVVGTLATTMVTDAARRRRERFYDACLRYAKGFARSGADGVFDLEGWDVEALRLRRARDAFYTAARSRMGVKALSASSSLIHQDGTPDPFRR